MIEIRETKDNYIIFLVGDYKTGKTITLCTFPKPLLLLDYDKGFKSVLHAKDEHGQLIVPDHKDITVIKFNAITASKTDFRTPEKGAKKEEAAYTKESLKIDDKFNRIMKELSEGGIVTDDEGNKKGPFKTLGIDSLTAMFDIWKNCTAAVNHLPDLRIQDYKTLNKVLFRQFIPTIKQLSDIDFIILTGHEVMEKDDLNNKTYEFPVGPSNAMGRLLGREFDEIWRQKIEGSKYIIRTRKDGMFQAGSRLHLPNPIEANYKEIKKFL